MNAYKTLKFNLVIYFDLTI